LRHISSGWCAIGTSEIAITTSSSVSRHGTTTIATIISGNVAARIISARAIRL
jgi:hypothetical protein